MKFDLWILRAGIGNLQFQYLNLRILTPEIRTREFDSEIRMPEFEIWNFNCDPWKLKSDNLNLNAEIGWAEIQLWKPNVVIWNLSFRSSSQFNGIFNSRFQIWNLKFEWSSLNREIWSWDRKLGIVSENWDLGTRVWNPAARQLKVETENCNSKRNSEFLMLKLEIMVLRKKSG